MDSDTLNRLGSAHIGISDFVAVGQIWGYKKGADPVSQFVSAIEEMNAARLLPLWLQSYTDDFGIEYQVAIREIPDPKLLI